MLSIASYHHLMLAAEWTPALFVFAFGACVGSLINVLVYRLPKGLPVVLPSSRCPSCEHRLTWRENIPILGWLLLRGRCRFCRERISAEYPLVEACVAILFLWCYVVWYLPDLSGAGVSVRAIQPEWAKNGVRETWPSFAVLLILVGSLVAMTIVDFRTYMIPLVLTWVPAGVALVLHPITGLLQGSSGFRYGSADLGGWVIALPTNTGLWWMGAAVGAAAGLGVSGVLIKLGLLRRSFEDYDEWEQEALRQQRAGDTSASPGGSEAEAAEATSDVPEMWLQYPHARREMVRELAFLGPVIGLAWLGGAVSASLGLAPFLAQPLWLQSVVGVATGYLIGAALVWGVRIFGTFLFGKEAMGLGDVHVLAAVGACLGWADAVLTFFAAVLVGLVSAIAGGIARSKSVRMLAFGPCLAIGAMMVVFGKPLIETGLTLLFSPAEPIDLP
ncbi:MAG: prepilin peptidase [Planctomycetota bacterium]